MTRKSRLGAVLACLALVSTMGVTLANAQRGRPRAPHPPVRSGVVFVGGYFYDPFFGPYPWWPRAAYPYPYYPVYDNRAEMRVLVSPSEAAVYVDGFYAGIVDDFDGFFQRLPLPAGGHEIVLYLEGYRTVHQHLYLTPGSTFKLQYTMERLPAGERSEPPPLAPPVPLPPVDTYLLPRTPPRVQPTPLPQPPVADIQATGYGALSLHIEPASADVTIDGARWTSSQAGEFVIQLGVGSHHVEVAAPGYQRFSADLEIRTGETMPLNVVLAKDR